MVLPKRKLNRLKEYDYGTPNAYFITICTVDKRCLFWKASDGRLECPQKYQLSGYGMIADRVINSIHAHYPAFSVDHYVIMPNHIHLLLQIHSDGIGCPMNTPTVSNVVNQMKGAITKQVGFPLWQKGFYDHVIRGEADYNEIWKYIEGNPAKWNEDKFHVPSL